MPKILLVIKCNLLMINTCYMYNNRGVTMNNAMKFKNKTRGLDKHSKQWGFF
jgi:hypothetical protein